jgi:hypothetical protein
MVGRTNSVWQWRLLFAAIATVGVLFTATSLAGAQGVWERGDEWRGEYKVGDRVELKINDAMWQKCTLVGNSPGSAMRLDCEEYVEPSPGTYSRAGGVYTNTSKNDIRPLGKTTAAKGKDAAKPQEKSGNDAKGREQPGQEAGGIERPDTGECPFNEPPGTSSRTARASEQLFKRVIFERYRDIESGREVGITFKTFSLANSFVNRLTGNGLLHDGAPQGATVYRYKTNFFTCVKYTDSILRTDVQEGYFACFKDKAGDWACAEDGRRNWDQKHLPVK